MARRRTVLQRDRSISQPIDSRSAVKSAARVTQILELFDDIKRSASVMEIADALGYPQSSTSALLRSLVALGYLQYDPAKRSYVTSVRVALLGSWINTHFFAEGAILRMMRELSERTGDTIVLATRNGLYAQYVHVIQATSPARLHMTLGTVRPLAYSGAGYALLSQLPKTDATRIITRYNAELSGDERRVNVREVLDILEQTRRRGYVMTTGIQTAGGGIIAAPIPQIGDKPGMTVGIGGISEILRAREAELGQLLADTVRRYSENPGSF
jgi:DNA-binding IclR family transcriptional regulator